jgi:hypothetical protein
MIASRRQTLSVAVLLALACAPIGRLFADDRTKKDESPTSPPPGAFVLVVMDPLALPLSCPCVKGYAQRDYDKLGKHIEARIKRPVYVAFADSLEKALKLKTDGKADLVVGKDSVVRKQSAKAGLKLAHAARLTGLDGKTTQTGLILVVAEDPALSVADIKGYTLYLGPDDCDEKSLAATNLIVESGLEKPKEPKTCSACDEGALKIIELNKAGGKAATVISSYAKPLLEGCGTIQKGELRVIGETEEVPFVAAFVNETLSEGERSAVRQSLLDVGSDKDLCGALESKNGFIAGEETKHVGPEARAESRGKN